MWRSEAAHNVRSFSSLFTLARTRYSFFLLGVVFLIQAPKGVADRIDVSPTVRDGGPWVESLSKGFDDLLWATATGILLGAPT